MLVPGITRTGACALTLRSRNQSSLSAIVRGFVSQVRWVMVFPTRTDMIRRSQQRKRDPATPEISESESDKHVATQSALRQDLDCMKGKGRANQYRRKQFWKRRQVKIEYYMAPLVLRVSPL